MPHKTSVRFIRCILTVTTCGMVMLGSGCGVPRYTSAWQAQSGLPTPRSEIHAATVGEKICVAGGISPITSAALECLNTKTNVWETYPDLPGRRHHIAVVADATHLYAIGGFSNLAFRAQAEAWRLDLETRQWETIASMPAPRGEHSAVMVGSHIYILGASGDRAAETWRYDIRANRWTVFGEPLQPARDSTATLWTAEGIWLIGGRNDQGDSKQVQQLNLQSGQWSAMPDLPAARAGHAAFAMNNEICVLGGESLAQATVYADVFCYTSATGAWTKTGDLPIGIHGLAAAVVNESVYALGGATRAGLRTPFSLNPSTYRLALPTH